VRAAENGRWDGENGFISTFDRLPRSGRGTRLPGDPTKRYGPSGKPLPAMLARSTTAVTRRMWSEARLTFWLTSFRGVGFDLPSIDCIS